MKTLIILSLTCFLLSCKNGTVSETPKVVTSPTPQIFSLSNIVDSSDHNFDLDFSKLEFTIIDFWQNSCPPCIAEMKQFPDLLKGKENKVSIVSISLTEFYLWKKTMQNHNDVFVFIRTNTPGWSQCNLRTKQDSSLHNSLSGDRIGELQSLYGVDVTPSYFVINQKGEIVSRPESAVAFLKDLK